jgi:heme A synthase
VADKPFFEHKRARPHQSRDRFFAAVFIGMVMLGVVSLYYSLNLISFLILLGLIALVLSIGWLAGSIRGGPDR